MPNIVIKTEDPGEDDVRALIAEGDAYFAARYPAESNHLLDIETLRGPAVWFFVARQNGKALGCGALARHEAGFGELKRMFVSSDARGLGLGRRLLGALEGQARALGIDCIRLETGIRQTEALALYRNAGYRDIGPFADYQLDPLSRFMEKSL